MDVAGTLWVVCMEKMEIKLARKQLAILKTKKESLTKELKLLEKQETRLKEEYQTKISNEFELLEKLKRELDAILLLEKENL